MPKNLRELTAASTCFLYENQVRGSSGVQYISERSASSSKSLQTTPQSFLGFFWGITGIMSSGPGDLYAPFIAQLILSKVTADFIIKQNRHNIPSNQGSQQQSSTLAGKRVRTTWEDSKVRTHPPIRSNSLISKLVPDTIFPLAPAVIDS